MNQDTKPAPFNVGDHVHYVGTQRRTMPAGQGEKTERVLAPGMDGVIVFSTGSLADQGVAAPDPWRCRVQFRNGFQLDITPETCDDFKAGKA